MKLTIGMATYDDYEGVYFTIQALRLYHPELNNIEYEIIVLDNNPSSKHGELTKKFIEGYVENGRYIPFTDYQSSFSKYKILQYAKGDIYVGLDCHVMLVNNSFRYIINYFSDERNNNNLLQGPLLTDDLKTTYTHMEPIWRGNMFGIWGNKESYIKGEPFEIELHGMGMFSCRTMNFPIISAKFRAFGGEEGYIHDKFRENGGVCVCHPEVKWIHRFNRPHITPFKNTYEDIIRNYIIGKQDLKKYDSAFIEQIRSHFSSFLSLEKIDKILDTLEPKNSINLLANNTLLSYEHIEFLDNEDTVTVHFNTHIHRNKLKKGKHYLLVNNFTGSGGGLFINKHSQERFDKIFINILSNQQDNPNILKDIDYFKSMNSDVTVVIQEDYMEDIPRNIYPSIGLIGCNIFLKSYNDVHLVGFTGGYNINNNVYSWGNHSWAIERAILRNKKHVTFKHCDIFPLIFRPSYLITPTKYKADYKALYEKTPLYGSDGINHIKTIQDLIKTENITSILDFGCGKNYVLLKYLRKIYENILLCGVDIVVSKNYADRIFISEDLPNFQFDLLWSNDCIEHIPLEELDVIMSHFNTIKPKIMYHIISTRRAFTNLPSGDNAHCTVQCAIDWLHYFEEKLPDYIINIKPNNKSDEVEFIMKLKP